MRRRRPRRGPDRSVARHRIAPGVRTFLRGRPPRRSDGAVDPDALADWLSSASVLPTEDLLPTLDDEGDNADSEDRDDGHP